MSAAAHAKYVYGVVPTAKAVPSGTGISRRRLHAVEGHDVAAIVSNAPVGDVPAGRNELMTHARVLERALERGVVLPMRFGVVMPDEDAVREQLLDSYRDDLVVQLHELEGKAELHLRAVYQEGALMQEIVEAHPDIGSLSTALREQPADATYYKRIELGQRIAQAVEQAAALDTTAILEALEPLAVAVHVGEPEHERIAANISFLIEQAQLPAFDKAVDELGRRNDGRLGFKYTGPLPAYSFVDLPGQG